jgi:hypothetical protein
MLNYELFTIFRIAITGKKDSEAVGNKLKIEYKGLKTGNIKK